MPLHKSKIRKGAYLTGGCHAVHAEMPPDLAATYHEVIAAAGPVPSTKRLAELAEEKRALSERLEAIKRRIAEFRSAAKI